jgi:hypothetical protein
MFKKSMAVAIAGVGLTLAAAGSASADVCLPGSSSFGGSTVGVDGNQTSPLTVNAPLVDGRCIAPWYGSGVVGGSTPIGAQDVVCNDVKVPVEQQSVGGNTVL